MLYVFTLFVVESHVSILCVMVCKLRCRSCTIVRVYSTLRASRRIKANGSERRLWILPIFLAFSFVFFSWIVVGEGIDITHYIFIFSNIRRLTPRIYACGFRILLIVSGITMIIASVGCSVAIILNDTTESTLWSDSSIAFLILFVVGFEIGLGLSLHLDICCIFTM